MAAVEYENMVVESLNDSREIAEMAKAINDTIKNKDVTVTHEMAHHLENIASRLCILSQYIHNPNLRTLSILWKTS